MTKSTCDHNPLLEKAMQKAGEPKCLDCENCGQSIYCSSCVKRYRRKQKPQDDYVELCFPCRDKLYPIDRDSLMSVITSMLGECPHCGDQQVSLIKRRDFINQF